MANPRVDKYGQPQSGTFANRPAAAVSSTGQTFWATDQGKLYVYDDVLGWTAMSSAGAGGSSGIGYTVRQRLIEAKNSDGTTLSATASAGKFGLAITAGTSENLVSEAAQNNTKTDVVLFETTLPQSYVAGTNLTLTVNAQHVEASGTTLTNTVNVAAYRCTDAGLQGANIQGGSAQAITGSAADYAFTITGATLNPGDRVMLTLTSVATEAGNTGTTKNQVNSVRLA